MTEADFWTLIAAGDDTARLALADWLEERGDVRASWVRDDDIFAHMLPDGRDPVPALVEFVTFEDSDLDPDMIGSSDPAIGRAYAKLGPAGVPCATGLARITVYALNESAEYDDEGFLLFNHGFSEIDAALAAIGPGCVPAILKVAKDAPDHFFTRAAHSLRLMARDAATALRTALSHRSVKVRGVAALALIDVDPVAAMPLLVESLRRAAAARKKGDAYPFADGIARAARRVAPPVEELQAILPDLDTSARLRLCEAHPDLGTDGLSQARRLLAKPSPTDADLRQARRLVEPHMKAREAESADVARRLWARLEAAEVG